MAKRLERKLAVLAKIETVYGTDPVPTGAANAMQVIDASFTPMSADKVDRKLYQVYLGSQPTDLAGEHVQLSYKIEMAGAGAAGDAPAWGVLMRACGAAEVITEDTMVEYNPVSAGYESVTQYYYLDGVLHKFLGARGNVKISMSPKQIPYLEFEFTGLQMVATDAALPTAALDAFVKPLVVSKANTPTFTFHGLAAIAESFSFDLGQKVETRFLINEDSVQIVDRMATGSMVIEAGLLATKDWYSLIRNRTQGALAIQHGAVAGNIVGFGCPACEIDPLSIGGTQGIINNTLPFTAIPTAAGNDEWVLTVK